MLVASLNIARAPCAATIMLDASGDGRFGVHVIEGHHNRILHESDSEVAAFSAFSAAVSSYLRHHGELDGIRAGLAIAPAHKTGGVAFLVAETRGTLRHAPDVDERWPHPSAAEVIAGEVLAPPQQPSLVERLSEEAIRDFDPKDGAPIRDGVSIAAAAFASDDVGAIDAEDLALDAISARDDAFRRPPPATFGTGSKDLYAVEAMGIRDVVVDQKVKGGGRRPGGRMLLVESNLPGHPFMSLYFITKKGMYRYLSTFQTRQEGVSDFRRRQERYQNTGEVF